MRAGGRGRVDVVLAMSPPLYAGAHRAGRSASFAARPLVFNVQDVFPDAAVRTGAIRNRRVIALADVARAGHAIAGRRR